MSTRKKRSRDALGDARQSALAAPLEAQFPLLREPCLLERCACCWQHGRLASAICVAAALLETVCPSDEPWDRAKSRHGLVVHPRDMPLQQATATPPNA